MIRKDREGRKFLMIFDSFITDVNLPKHKKEVKKSGLSVAVDGIWGGNWSEPSSSEFDRSFMEKMAYGNGFWNSVLYWLFSRVGLFKLLGKKNKTPKLNSNTILSFFESIKAAKKFLNLTDSTLLDAYEKAVSDAMSTGQTALIENLKDSRDLVLMESKLIKEGVETYILDEDVIKFYELTDETKKLKLVWIKNFVRIIPQEVIEIKKKVDGYKVFDNYVILTFDPLDQMEKMTKKEVEDSKDPILFGVIKGSNKLYFIADWEDEYCNLRLENVLEKLGKDPSLLNNQPVTIYSQKKV